jgi:thiamine pyrophosphate-dependent acetolactate synthase large subunit-like protein
MTSPTPSLDRRVVTERLLRDRGNALVVAGLGSTSYDVLKLGDNPLDFTLFGAMGAAAMIGLGLAKAQPTRRVVVITGDGEMLMGLGSLATIGVAQPSNLAIVVIDNGLFAETGMQRAHTGYGIDLAVMAQGARFASSETIIDADQLGAFAARLYSAPGPLFAAVKVAPVPTPITLPKTMDGTQLRGRFRQALLGEKAYD